MNSSVFLSSADNWLDVLIEFPAPVPRKQAPLFLYLFTRRISQPFYSCFIAKFLPKALVSEDWSILVPDTLSVESSTVSAKMRSHDRHLAGDSEKSVRSHISIIVPVFNEAPLIRPFLQHLRERATAAEIIVADGRSSDGSAQLAAGFCDQLVESECNRAMQMNSGARAARGQILWFVHVDAEVPRECLGEIGRIMDDPNVVGGHFRIRLPRGFVYRLTDTFAHYAGILLRMRCGDHGIFCRRTAFLDIGGFPEVPLMEDVELFRQLYRHGRVTCSDKRILVSPRRYESIGQTRLTLAYGVIATLYIFGVPLSILARIYNRMCCDRREVTAPHT